MKKTILFSLLILVVLIVGVVIGLYVDNNADVLEKATKEIILPTYTTQSVVMTVPSSYNVYYDGNPEVITNSSQPLTFSGVSMSISSADRPVTLSDMNWQQLDFYLTDSNIYSKEYFNNQETIPGQSVEQIVINEFSGYKITDLIQSDNPSKADTGGVRYYLTTSTDGHEWNLIINKQSIGDTDFENKAMSIINSISLSN